MCLSSSTAKKNTKAYESQDCLMSVVSFFWHCLPLYQRKKMYQLASFAFLIVL
jgi:hypothetical protein